MNKRMREVPLGALMAAVEIMDADFDSAIPRFESWRPSHPVRSPTYFPATPRNWRKALKPRSLSLPESARCTAIASAGGSSQPAEPAAMGSGATGAADFHRRAWSLTMVN